MAKRTSHPAQLSLDFDAPIAVVVVVEVAPEPDAEPFPREGPRLPDTISDTMKRLVLGCEIAGWRASAIAEALGVPLADIAPVVENLQRTRPDMHVREPEDAPLGGAVELVMRGDEIEVVTPNGRSLGHAPENVATLLGNMLVRTDMTLRAYLHRTMLQHGHQEILVVRDGENGRNHNFFRCLRPGADDIRHAA